MKILHTADLHLGQTFHNFDRSEEQAKALECIEKIIEERQPDAYIISGDIFHTITPTTAAQELLIHHLMHAHELSPGMKIVVTAGNHDSNRIEIDAPLWNLVDVEVIASIRRNILGGEDDPEYLRELMNHHIIVVGDPDAPKGYIVALPHCYPANFPSVEPSLPKEERAQKFIQLLLDEVSRRNTDGAPVVLMAHTAVRKESGSDPDALGQDLDLIGGIDMVDSSTFGAGYDYVALGHIHYAQDINPHIRYSGSVLPVSFDEDYQHSVSFVDIAAHGDLPVVEVIPVKNTMPVITVPSRDPENPSELQSITWAEALEALQNFPADQEGYLRVNVTDDGTIPADAKDVATKLTSTRGIKARFCMINRIKKKSGTESAPQTRVRLSTSQLGKMTPMQLAEMFYKEKYDIEIPAEFRTLLESVISETHNA